MKKNTKATETELFFKKLFGMVEDILQSMKKDKIEIFGVALLCFDKGRKGKQQRIEMSPLPLEFSDDWGKHIVFKALEEITLEVKADAVVIVLPALVSECTIIKGGNIKEVEKSVPLPSKDPKALDVISVSILTPDKNELKTYLDDEELTFHSHSEDAEIRMINPWNKDKGTVM